MIYILRPNQDLFRNRFRLGLKMYIFLILEFKLRYILEYLEIRRNLWLRKECTRMYKRTAWIGLMKRIYQQLDRFIWLNDCGISQSEYNHAMYGICYIWKLLEIIMMCIWLVTCCYWLTCLTTLEVYVYSSIRSIHIITLPV